MRFKGRAGTDVDGQPVRSGVDTTGLIITQKMLQIGTAVDSGGIAYPIGAAYVELASGAALIGSVSIDQTTPGTSNLVALAANQSVNVAQMNGVTTTMGNGISGTGVQRVVIASDNTAFAVNAQATPNAGVTYAYTTVSSTAYEASHVAKASAGNLYGLFGYNSGPAQFIQVHNTTTVPADTAIPIAILNVAAAANFAIDLGPYPINCSVGITICNSTTGPTKTIGATNCFFTILVA